MRKIVWITGAGKGIGRALALKMAREGWTVAASARTEADIRSLVLESEDYRIHAFPLLGNRIRVFPTLGDRIYASPPFSRGVPHGQ